MANRWFITKPVNFDDSLSKNGPFINVQVSLTVTQLYDFWSILKETTKPHNSHRNTGNHFYAT